MFKTMRARKGVTLAEITVALALVSIMITLVVSFVISITTRTKANAAYDAMRRDCTLIESVAERWMKEVAKSGYSIPNSSAVTTLTAKEDLDNPTSAQCDLSFSQNHFIGELPIGSIIKIRTETVKSITFDALNDTETMLICHITCVNPENGDEVDFHICVNPRVGDAVNLGG